MMRNAFGRLACHRVAVTATIVAFFALLADCRISHRLEAAEAKNSTPKIVTARVGLNNHYKLGFWTPIRVEIAGAESATDLTVEVTVADSDGVPTTAATPLTPTGDAAGNRSVTVYTMVGRVGGPIRIALIDDEHELDSLTLVPNAKGSPETAIVPIPATSELIVSLAAAPFGLSDALGDRDASPSQPGRKLIELNTIADLPTEWFGYSAIDVLMIPSGDGKLVSELAADRAKFAAMQQWIQLGGRVVLFCGAENANELLAADGPLSPLVTGKFAEVVRMPEAGPLERFANVIAPIAGAVLEVPRLTNVEGKIEAFWQSTDLPLVVRTPYGFGEVTFVGVEFSQPPLATWSARNAFLRALVRPFIPDLTSNDSSQRLMSSGFNDLSGALRQRLGRTFSLVVPIGFPIVTGLAIAYLLVLGPIDYFLVTRWLRRPLAAWLTFPFMVVAFSLLAVLLANRSKGSPNPRANQLQLVDFDMIGGQVRGTYWAALYSPSANQFDLTIKLANTSSAAKVDNDDTLFSWWGLPGFGIGGMQTGGADLGIIPHGYRFGPDRNSLEDLPVLSSATKSLVARWTGGGPANVDSTLTDDEGLVSGGVTNETGVTLRNVRLLYGSWGYRLGTLKPGQHVDVTEQLSPRSTKTIVTRDALGQTGANVAEENRVFSAEQATAKDILNLMMFYDVAGGQNFAHLPNRYQAFVDMSRQLELGRAILVAEAEIEGAQLVDSATGQPVNDGKLSTGAVIYRFILPVKKTAP